MNIYALILKGCPLRENARFGSEFRDDTLYFAYSDNWKNSIKLVEERIASYSFCFEDQVPFVIQVALLGGNEIIEYPRVISGPLSGDISINGAQILWTRESVDGGWVKEDREYKYWFVVRSVDVFRGVQKNSDIPFYIFENFYIVGTKDRNEVESKVKKIIERKSESPWEITIEEKKAILSLGERIRIEELPDRDLCFRSLYEISSSYFLIAGADEFDSFVKGGEADVEYITTNEDPFKGKELFL